MLNMTLHISHNSLLTLYLYILWILEFKYSIIIIIIIIIIVVILLLLLLL